MNKRAEIAGGGFAGLSMAIALRQIGWEVRVFESHQTLREIGAGIFLWDNALNALEKLGVLGAVEKKSAQPGGTIVIRDGVETARNQANHDANDRMWTISRHALHHILVERALSIGVKVETNARVVGARRDGSLTLADGREYSADLVVGADGIGSTVRESLGIEAKRTDFNYGILRVLLNQETLRTDVVTDYWSMSPRARRILSVPCDDSSLYLALMCAADDHDAAGLPFQLDTWSAAFPELESTLQKIVDDGVITHYNLYSTVHVPRWTAGRCALLGDAAHGMPPTMGQGAGSAIWNAVSLAQNLARYDDVQTGLAFWERICRPITTETQKKSEALAALGPARSAHSKTELLHHSAEVSEKLVQGHISVDLASMLNFEFDVDALQDYRGLDWYDLAMEIIDEYHAGQWDRLQRPATEHFPRVMQRLLRLNPKANTAQLQASLLHDALEPGHYTKEDLLARGVSQDALRIISRISLPQDGRTYLQYIDDLASGPDIEAKEVKLADNYDAYDLFLMLGTQEGIDRVRTQYHPSVSRLRASLVA